MPRARTSAWPLAWVYAGLIAYASLYPFGPWRDQGLVPWAFLWAPWPPYWSGFDVVANALGYAPLGFFLALGVLRSGAPNWQLIWAPLAGLVVSACMEMLQVYLPQRVPSSLDFLLNTVGALVGAVLAVWLHRLGVWQRWSRLRAVWLADDAHAGLALLALWPLALLYPTSPPLALGQVWLPLQSAVADWLQGTPWASAWEPLTQVWLEPSPLAQFWRVMLGCWLPGLLAFGLAGRPAHRLVLLVLLALAGAAMLTLGQALSLGPAHALDGWGAWTGWAVGLAVVVLVALLGMRQRMSWALLVLVLGVFLADISQLPGDPYAQSTLFAWEQGRFVRFYGVAQWLSWLWPWAVLGYGLAELESRKEPH